MKITVKASGGPQQRLQPAFPNSKSTNSQGTSSNKAGIKRRKQQVQNSTFSLSMVVIFSIVLAFLIYVVMVVSFTRALTIGEDSQGIQQDNMRKDYPRGGAGPPRTASQGKKNPNYVPNFYARDQWGDQKPATVRQAGNGIKPQLLRKQVSTGDDLKDADVAPDPTSRENMNLISDSRGPILTAYLEPIDRFSWKKRPLPVRNATAKDLKEIKFPLLNSCRRLPEQWPVDDYPQEDPFLPWIHDVFPTHDGKFIQFVAQNRRRCRTGTTSQDIDLLAHTEPQVALFQHVAVQRLNKTGPYPSRYRLVDHQHADKDGMETRFICRFQPSGEETLSVYNFNYEWASYRKHIRQMFHEEGRDNKQIHTSQLTFKCPVPQSLVEPVRTGVSVVGDYATLFVDLIPIRTPPRYGPPGAFFPPHYEEFQVTGKGAFDATLEWGSDHVVPLVENSGRWANIPICKPSLLTYGKQKHDTAALAVAADKSDLSQAVEPIKQHHLASCLWASTGYATRGGRFAINDGQRRLLEWITYNKLIGVDHFYLYDNSGAFSDDRTNSLHPIAELFPDDVTVIDWPGKVCNNNPNNVDSVGERSSQYAAEASCRLRFGPHVNWIAQFDIDEYLVPMANQSSILPLLEKLDQEGNKIVSFGSWRAWPRRRFIETPVKLHGSQYCGREQDCFELKIPMNYTMLQTYNCDRQKPGEKMHQMPAEKQIYRPDYVKHHFIHYSTVTGMSVMNREDTINSGHKWIAAGAFPDPLSRFGDEVNEALMLHSKAVATQDTTFWETACKAAYHGTQTCRLGTPFPEDMRGVNESRGDAGWKFNCYVNHKIDDYWVPLLEKNLKEHIPELASRMEG